jgi:hypothetical protein
METALCPEIKVDLDLVAIVSTFLTNSVFISASSLARRDSKSRRVEILSMENPLNHLRTLVKRITKTTMRIIMAKRISTMNRSETSPP